MFAYNCNKIHTHQNCQAHSRTFNYRSWTDFLWNFNLVSKCLWNGCWALLIDHFFSFWKFVETLSRWSLKCFKRSSRVSKAISSLFFFEGFFLHCFANQSIIRSLITWIPHTQSINYYYSSLLWSSVKEGFFSFASFLRSESKSFVREITKIKGKKIFEKTALILCAILLLGDVSCECVCIFK